MMSISTHPTATSSWTGRRLLYCLAFGTLVVACSDSSGDAVEVGDLGAGGTGEQPKPDDRSNDLLIDDFEDGDKKSSFGTDWFTYTDTSEGGGSLITSTDWIASEGFQSKGRLALPFKLEKGSWAYDPFIGFGVETPAKVSQFQGLSYFYRGPSHVARVETSDVTDHDFFLTQVAASTEWRQVAIPFDRLWQTGFGKTVSWDSSKVTGVSWHVAGPDGKKDVLELDDIYFEKDLGDVDKGAKDLVLHEPEVPAFAAVGPGTIANPLQVRAAELDRGYTITNWLEQKRFAGFEYGEAYVQKVAAAGFRALRLPIDMDLYVTGQTGSGETLTVELHPDFFDILDSFNDWTEQHDLSLTIDYHQYDSSLKLQDPASVDLVVALWKAVAAHFSTDPRTDIYFELMNEPELSSGSSIILPAALWTTAAQRMISAIRSVDENHTIIFGDVNWYGIDKLVERAPFTDGNIIYAFHFYEPFIFTHQGASWGQMGSTGKVPYPYALERWSEHGSDFGLNQEHPAWVWDLFRNYYKTGNRAALYNSIVRAKNWGIAHNVPILCNEFGMYGVRASRDDKLQYYKDVVGIFSELQIPWQHWFMMLRQDGTVADQDLLDALL